MSEKWFLLIFNGLLLYSVMELSTSEVKHYFSFKKIKNVTGLIVCCKVLLLCSVSQVSDSALLELCLQLC